jgi:hypothetical protein
MIGMKLAFMVYMVHLALAWLKGKVSNGLGGDEKSNSAKITLPCLEENIEDFNKVF